MCGDDGRASLYHEVDKRATCFVLIDNTSVKPDVVLNYQLPRDTIICCPSKRVHETTPCEWWKNTECLLSTLLVLMRRFWFWE
jgi:hypothetical protein